MSFRSLLNKTINVSRAVRVSDGAGGFDETWTNVYVDAPCRIMPMSGKEQSFYAADKAVPTHKIFMEKDISITEKDRLLFGTRIFDIELVRKIDETFHLEVDVREVDIT